MLPEHVSPYGPVQELVYLVCCRFCVCSHIFVGVRKGGFNDRFDNVFGQHAKPAGDMSQTHHCVSADFVVRVRYKSEADVFSKRPVV